MRTSSHIARFGADRRLPSYRSERSGEFTQDNRDADRLFPCQAGQWIVADGLRINPHNDAETKGAIVLRQKISRCRGARQNSNDTP